MFSFQTLPYLIIDNIIVWYCRSSNGKWETLSPVLGVCQSWRSVALPYLFKEYEVGPEKARLGLWPSGLSQPVSNMASWVKCLQIYLPLPIGRLYVGDNIPVFSKARVLVVDAKLNSWKRLDHIHGRTPVETFVLPIQRIAPNARKLIINLKIPEAFNTANQATESLDILKFSILLEINGLTNFIIGGGAFPTGFKLVSKFSKTLEILAIVEYDMSTCFSELVVNQNTGKHRIYPNLKHLAIVFPGTYPDRIKQTPVFSRDVVPFPNLQRLECPKGYPFGDDILFRGNQHSLKSISLLLDDDTTKMLVDHRVFSKDTHPNLCFVSVLLKANIPLSTIYGMAQHTQVFRITIPLYLGSLLVNFILNVGKLEQLRVLDLNASILTLEQVYKLGKGLPNLEKLICKNLTGYSNEAPHDNIGKSPPISHSLKVLRLMNDTSDITLDMVGSAMRFVSVCPNIYLVTIKNNGQLAKFKDRWNHLIFAGQFKEHALRLFSIRIFHVSKL